MEKEKITLGQIAKKVGVSKTVVSAVLNKKENKKIFVSEEKKKKILELVSKYHYYPRKSAKELATGKTNTIGVILHRLTPFFSLLLEELQKEAFKRELEITPYITEGIDEKEEEFLRMMRDGRVDGVIITAFVEGSRERCRKFSSPPYNLKILTITVPVKNIPSVRFDGVKAGKLAAEHLIETGCRRLCFYGGDGKCERLKGFIEYIKKKKLSDPVVITDKNFRGYFPDGVKYAKKFLSLKKLPDGVFVYNDLVAAGLLSELIKNGIKVPDEVSIISCDNTEVCLYTNPKLTSINSHPSLLAKIALEKMLLFIDGKKIEPLHTKVEPHLVIRDSTRK
ncbi:LacI family DNA-binding transcriptional regulator [bacterium]|nr:LacI family DNA-binding transcriptional regulator [bacterium]